MNVEILSKTKTPITNDSAKLILMDQIVSHFTPLFNDEIERKLDRVKENRNDIINLKKKIQETQSKLTIIDKRNQIELLKSEILDEIDYLLNVDVLYGNNKQVVKDILHSISDSKSEQLTTYLKRLREMSRIQRK